METLGIFAAIGAAGIWAGSIVFHSAVVAPATFKVLSADDAGLFLRRLFPAFFRFGLVCGALMIVGLLLALGPRAALTSLTMALAIAMCVLQVICLAMVPAINAARDQGEAGRQRFGRLHGINVMLTLGVLVMGVIVIYRLAV